MNLSLHPLGHHPQSRYELFDSAVVVVCIVIHHCGSFESAVVVVCSSCVCMLCMQQSAVEPVQLQLSRGVAVGMAAGTQPGQLGSALLLPRTLPQLPAH